MDVTAYPSLVVVLDTNVWVSGTALTQTPPSQIINAWHEGAFDVAVSEPLLEEIRDVFRRPYWQARSGWSDVYLESYIAAIRDAAMVVSGTTPVEVCRDPKDNRVFSCAVEAQVAYIVSGDNDVLAVGEYGAIVTISPKDFVEQVVQRESMN